MNSITLFEKSIIAKYLSARDKIKFVSFLSKEWRKIVYSGYGWNSLFYDVADKTWIKNGLNKKILQYFSDLHGISILYLTK